MKIGVEVLSHIKQRFEVDWEYKEHLSMVVCFRSQFGVV